MWDDLSLLQRELWTNLGWDQQTWDTGSFKSIATENKFCWEDGTEAQIQNASSLCYTRLGWNQAMFNWFRMSCGTESKIIFL